MSRKRPTGEIKAEIGRLEKAESGRKKPDRDEKSVYLKQRPNETPVKAG